MYRLIPELKRPPSVDEEPDKMGLIADCASILSPRLARLASELPATSHHVDIATGHGRLPCALALQNRDREIIGTDRSRPEIEAARKQASELGCRTAINFLVTDEIPAIQRQAEESAAYTLSASGLGGRSMARLLLDQPARIAQFDMVVLQPNRGEHLVRAALSELGWTQVNEWLVYDDGYFYLGITARRCGAESERLTADEIRTGRWSVQQLRHDPLLPHYLGWHLRAARRKLRGVRQGGEADAISAVEQHVRSLQNVLDHVTKLRD